MSVFGKHNVLNMQAAIDVCMQLGIEEQSCWKAMSTFTGAARRLEKVKEEEHLLIYRDFAHAPSKLKATLQAVREAYPKHLLIACFELHTYSSLNENFLIEYAHSMDAAEKGVIYFSHHALSIKGLPDINKEMICKYFKRDDLQAIDSKEILFDTICKLVNEKDKPVFLLLMSSGTFDGIDWNTVCSHK